MYFKHLMQYKWYVMASLLMIVGIVAAALIPPQLWQNVDRQNK